MTRIIGALVVALVLVVGIEPIAMRWERRQAEKRQRQEAEQRTRSARTLDQQRRAGVR